MKKVIVALACVLTVLSGAALGQITVKIGVLTDMSGTYSDLAGPGSVLAAKMAIEDFNPAANGMKVELVSADHQNKADVGSNVARTWFDREGVDAIVDVPTSGVALAVNDVAAAKNKALLLSGPATEALTGKNCKPTTVHWTYGTYPLAQGVAKAIVKQGGDTWFFITGDFSVGYALEADTASVVKANGGRVLGAVRAPLGTTEYSSFLVQAQASKAKIIGLAITGNDLTTAVKQGAEFGITESGQKWASMIMFISDVHAMGLKSAQGMLLVTGFYWDLNDDTRNFARRFVASNNGRYPTMVHAGVYSSVLHYLRAVKKVGNAADGAKVVTEMKKNEIDDKLFGKVTIQPSGRAIHNMYLVEVKKPSESKGPYDYYHIRATIPADQAFRPLAESGCSLVK
jgi:branched-chain amino acid transport system substrate-binding protein